MLSARIVSQWRVPTFIPTRISPFLDGGLGRRAARRDGLDVEAAAQLGRDGRDVIVRDRLGLHSQQPPDQVVGARRPRRRVA